jgi:hypothetical protein
MNARSQVFELVSNNNETGFFLLLHKRLNYVYLGLRSYLNARIVHILQCRRYDTIHVLYREVEEV